MPSLRRVVVERGACGLRCLAKSSRYQSFEEEGEDTMRGSILKDRADKIMNDIYTAYGTDTGILFGIPAERKGAVRAIVELVLEETDK